MKKTMIVLTALLLTPTVLACLETRPKQVFVIQDLDQVIRVDLKNNCDKILRDLRVRNSFLEIDRRISVLAENDTLFLVVNVLKGEYNTTMVFEYDNQTSTQNLVVNSGAEEEVRQETMREVNELNKEFHEFNNSLNTSLIPFKQELVNRTNKVNSQITRAVEELGANNYYQSQLLLSRARNDLKELKEDAARELVYAALIIILAVVFLGIIPLGLLVSKKFFNYTVQPGILLKFLRVRLWRVRITRAVRKFKNKVRALKKKVIIKFKHYLKRRRSRSK